MKGKVSKEKGDGVRKKDFFRIVQRDGLLREILQTWDYCNVSIYNI